jgi:hypothetical protein
MLGHERPPRRARPDDPGQPGAGDARGRSDAARSAAGPYTDTGGDAIAADAGPIYVHVSDALEVTGTHIIAASYDGTEFHPHRRDADTYWHAHRGDAARHTHPDALALADPDSGPGAIGDALNPDSDPAT